MFGTVGLLVWTLADHRPSLGGMEFLWECWLPVIGWEGLYEVSDQGRVRSLDHVVYKRSRWGGTARQLYRGQVLIPGTNPRGYLIVSLCRDGHQETRAIHRLVLEAFAGPCPPGKEACHGPRGKLDNTWDGTDDHLRWDTHGSNCEDRTRDGHQPVGSQHPQAKLTEAIVRECRIRYVAGEVYESLAREFGVNSHTMWSALTGETWTHLPVPEGIYNRAKKIGSKAPQAKLTEEIVLECRRRHAAGESIYSLARESGVSYLAMRNAMRGDTWKHVKHPEE